MPSVRSTAARASDSAASIVGACPASRGSAEAGRITGRPIAVVDVTDEQLAAGAKAAGVPDFVIEHFIVAFDRNTRERKVEAVTDAVESLWGEKPMSVADVLAANRAALLGTP